MTTVLRASDSADFLGIVPALAGCTPRRSIVLVPFRQIRSLGAMRLDLPSDAVDLREYADAAVGLVSRVSGTDAVALVVYTDDPIGVTLDGLVLPHAVAVDEVLGRAEDTGLRIVDALCVTPDGWSSYLDDDPQLHTLDSMTAAPDMPELGDVAGDQLSGLVLPATDLAWKERVGRALRDMAEVIDHDADGGLTGRENPQALAALAALDDIPAFFEAVLGRSDSNPPFALAALLWCLDRPVFRDVAIAQWATDLDGGVRTLHAQLAFAHLGRPLSDELGGVFVGMGPAPDPERLRCALTVVRHAAAAAPRASRPGALTAAAWLSWALGRGSHAGHYLDLVREIDPQHGLAALLTTMIDAPTLPEWAFQRESAAPSAGAAT